MESRSALLLKNIVREYIRTAQPVASGVLARQCGLEVSSATIRNEMAELERAGYIYQPHTSAGRIPTEAAYRFYLENLPARPMSTKLVQKISAALAANNPAAAVSSARSVTDDWETQVKLAARQVADLCSNAVIVSFERGNNYYTGLSQLFAQPEFQEYALVCQISELVDRLDERLEQNWPELEPEQVRVFIGQENPLAKDCAWVVVELTHAKYGQGLFSVLGPIRMDYEKIMAIVSQMKNLLN